MIDETEKVISSKEREKQIEENKEIGITITHHDRREHYSKILGSKQVFAIAINHHYDENKIFETIDRIALNPFAFRECEEIPTTTKIYRRAVCFSWLIIYKITNAEIVVLGIIHGSRRPSKIKKLKKIK